MERNVFISFLGSTNYGKCDYQKDGISYGYTRFIQEATINYLQRDGNWPSTSRALILLTEGSKAKNWEDGGHKDRETQEPLDGLKTTLAKMNLPFPVDITDPVIPDGNNEEEIWKIFKRVFDYLDDGDNVYFDITHGFRYLPMLTIVLGNYAKFLKKVSVKSITYGNYEVSDQGKKPGPIVDLMPLSMLQDWSYAAGQYLMSGHVKPLVDMSKEAIGSQLIANKNGKEGFDKIDLFMKQLSHTVEDMRTCRGKSIVESKNINKLKSLAAEINTDTIEPLEPILEKVKDSLSVFDLSENVRNGFEAANWCLNNGLYQQAITLLQENIITYVCIENNYDWRDDNYRSCVRGAFHHVIKPNAPYEESTIPQLLIAQRNLYQSSTIIGLAKPYESLRYLRNDFNHAGMLKNTKEKTPANIMNEIKQCFGNINKAIVKINTK